MVEDITAQLLRAVREEHRALKSEIRAEHRTLQHTVREEHRTLKAESGRTRQDVGILISMLQGGRACRNPPDDVVSLTDAASREDEADGNVALDVDATGQRAREPERSLPSQLPLPGSLGTSGAISGPGPSVIGQPQLAEPVATDGPGARGGRGRGRDAKGKAALLGFAAGSKAGARSSGASGLDAALMEELHQSERSLSSKKSGRRRPVQRQSHGRTTPRATPPDKASEVQYGSSSEAARRKPPEGRPSWDSARSMSPRTSSSRSSSSRARRRLETLGGELAQELWEPGEGHSVTPGAWPPALQGYHRGLTMQLEPVVSGAEEPEPPEPPGRKSMGVVPSDSPPDAAKASSPYAVGLRPLQSRCRVFRTHALARLCGIMPWSAQRPWAAWLYQQLLAAVAATAAVAFTWRLAASSAEGQLMNSPALLEALLAVGTLVGLLSCGVHRSSRGLVRAETAFTASVSRHDIWLARGRLHRWDSVVSLLMWAAAVGIHACVTSLDDPSARWLRVMGFAFVSLLHTGLVCTMARTCHRLMVILDTFCQAVFAHKNFVMAVNEWHCIQAPCQIMCQALQSCFLVLAALGALILLAMVHGMRNEQGGASILPVLLLTLASLRVPIFAAAVTYQCTLVPTLVNRVNVGKVAFDSARMYAVQYIRYSRCGFYTFGHSITGGTVMKAFYVVCAAAFGIYTQSDPT